MKTFNLFAIIFFVGVVVFIIYKTLETKDTIYTTKSLEIRDIYEEIHIPGNIYPLKEIEVKSQLSGILDRMYVKIGDQVNLQTPIASIRLVPNISDIERLESSVASSQIEYDARLVEYNRAKRLYETNTISKAEMESVEKFLKQIKEQLNSAINQLDIVKKGEIISKNISNIVTSSTSGIIIDLPIDEGVSVIERNNYNPGTTLAIIAQMDRFKFQTLIAEHYLHNINIGDTISLSINAFDDITAMAVITQISSKGSSVSGVMKYSLNAEFEVTDDMPTLRSGYSASAKIVLSQKTKVASIEEKHIRYSGDSIFVETLDSLANSVVNKLIDIGISDGTYTEILKGVDVDDKIIID
jgi:HlyD family secretion protein